MDNLVHASLFAQVCNTSPKWIPKAKMLYLLIGNVGSGLLVCSFWPSKNWKQLNELIIEEKAPGES